MKIISWNPNGIRALLKKINILQFIDKYNPDILCFNETKASLAVSNFHLQTKFKYQYWNCSQAKKGYAGTAVLSKIKPISVEKSPFDKEGRLICLEFEDYYLINVYVPNSGQELKRLEYRVNEWDVQLREYVLKKKKPVIMVGDFNVARTEIDLARPKSNKKSSGFTKEERESFEKLLEIGLIDTFRYFYPKEIKYSYWGYRFRCREKNLGWRIDYGLVSEKLKDRINNALILDEEIGSDHAPIVLEIKSHNNNIE